MRRSIPICSSSRFASTTTTTKRTRSILLDLPILNRHSPSTTLSSSQQINSDRKNDPAEKELYLSILKSPLRRCILTNKILPKDFLLSFKLFKNDSKGLIIQPSGILNPKFEIKPKGKSIHVVCWNQAVELMSSQGQYKRFDSRSTFPLSTNLAKIDSMLARRIVQETLLLFEKFEAISEKLANSIGFENVFQRLDQIQPLDINQSLTLIDDGNLKKNEEEKKGWKIRCIIDLRPSSSESESPIITYLGAEKENKIPIYHLHAFFTSIQIPPTSNEGRFKIPLEKQMIFRIERFLSVLASRKKQKIRKDVEKGLYAIFTPDLKVVEDDRGRVNENVLPLLKALWKVKMWKGQGWEDGQEI